MNLQQLRYARALAELDSFVDAADRCGVTQPTLSNGIAQLEAELSVRLFARTTRTVQLTEHGEQLLPCILDVLNAQTALVAKARQLTSPEKRLLRIGVSPLVGMNLVSLIVEPFRLAHPDVEIVFRELNLAEMMRLLEVAQLEFVFGPVDIDVEIGAQLQSVLLHQEPLVFVAKGPSLQNVGATKTNVFPPVALKDIANHVFVMVPDSCGLATTTRAAFRRHRLKLSEYSGTAMSYRVLQEWAQLGIGAAIVPLSKAIDGATAEILIRKGQDERLTISYQACWSKSTSTNAAVSALGTYLKDVALSIVSGLGSHQTIA